MNLGYDLFLDKSSLKATFIVADFLDPSSPLASLDNQIDIVHAAAVLHLFDRATQKKVVQRITRLLKPKAGSVCIGRQIGDTKPSEVAVGGGRILFRHNTDTFRELWDEVGKETDVKWSVQAKMDFDDPSFAIQSLQRSGDEAGWLVFSVRRIV